MSNHIFSKFICGVELLYIYDNYNPFSNNFDQKCIGWNTKGRPCAIILRTYY